MALSQSLRLNQSTNLVMTPQLQQAIKLLQLSYQDLESFITEQVNENPLLQLDEGMERTDFFPATTPFSGSTGHQSDWEKPPIPSTPISLREHVLSQVNSQFLDPVMRLLAVHLTTFLQPTGYFDEDLSEIATKVGAPIDQILDVFHHVQQFDPPGIFARNLQECITLQLLDKGLLTAPFEIFIQNLNLLGQGNITALLKRCRVSEATLIKMIKTVRSLHPKPGLLFDSNHSPSIIPEVLMLNKNYDEWSVDLNPETCPKVLLNFVYYTDINKNLTIPEDKKYLSERLTHANWLIKALHQRATTLIKVSKEIIKQQEAFFKNGIAYLKPLTLRDVAQALELHESTISRVTNNKYISTPRGIFELKYFFNTSLEGNSGITYAAPSIRHRIQALVSQEKPDEPLSDDKIASLLNHEGIAVARRTIAKYREMMRIPPAFQRKKCIIS